MHAKGQKVPRKLIKLLCPGGRLPLFKIQFAEIAFEFIINNPDIFSEETALNLKRVLSQHGLIQRRKVRLVSNDRIKRSLISSMGKLNSIVNIVDTEARVLGQSLRMLILTDYIKKDLLKIVGTDQAIDTMGTVPIFEAIRRHTQSQLKVAVLSGTLVIIPSTVIEDVKDIAASKNIAISVKPVGDKNYSELLFQSSNKGKVAVMTEAFQQGLIHVLIGTKSLLGEGWDSPCINSLILASFVGSFVLSNQMRGRAIRTYARNPKKVSNIWHLVTVEPTFLSIADLLKNLYNPDMYNKEHIVSEDYKMLVRRFECFIAPSYDGSMIENGIGRINIIKPPYDKKGIEHINQQMRAQSADRAALAQQWQNALNSIGHTEIAHVNELPKKVLPTRFVFINWFNVMLLNLAFIILIRNLVISVFSSANFTVLLVHVVIVAVISYLLFTGYSKLIRYISPKRTIKTLGNCVLKSLKEIDEIESQHAKLHIHANKSNTLISCMLRNATTHEKNVFAGAMSELLTSINNPRYVLIKRRRFLVLSWKDYSHSYACPALLAVKKETVNILGKHLRQTTGKFDLIYTRSEAGRKALLRCRKHSYININEIYIKGKRIVKSKWE